MPSELFVEICKIEKLDVHPNADRLEVALVKGWQCVVQKDIYKVGDKVVYFPIDSVLPELVEAKIFGEDSKIKLKDSRVRTIKLRKVISQGLIVPIALFDFKDNIKVGTNVKTELGITKYELPQKGNPMGQSEPAKKRSGNDNFSKYTKINHLSNFPFLFKDKQVIVHEKIHGTNFRCGYVTKTPKNWWEHIKVFFSKSEREFVYGSHNVQLKNGSKASGFYPTNIYWKMVEKYELRKVARELSEATGEDVIIYGEVYGHGIQKGYDYGLKDSQKLAVFDIKVGGTYVNAYRLTSYCACRNLPTAPFMFEGAFDEGVIKVLASGYSTLNSKQKVIEGVVVRSIGRNRDVAKFINPEYLLKDNSEWA